MLVKFTNLHNLQCIIKYQSINKSYVGKIFQKSKKLYGQPFPWKRGFFSVNWSLVLCLYLCIACIQVTLAHGYCASSKLKLKMLKC